jgi:alkyl sulfatase BDS1-like metallo-beta-lactamase superfamily hydrolase
MHDAHHAIRIGHAAAKAVVLLAATTLAMQPVDAQAQAGLGRVNGSQNFDFRRIGEDQKEPLKVNEAIYQAIGFGNTFLITTPEGNAIVDTSAAGTANRHHDLLSKVSAAPIRYIILTHGHGDHTGGVHLWKQDGTQIVTQRNFPSFCAYQERLAGYFARANAAQFNLDEGRLRSLYQSPNNRVEPTVTFADRHDLELGGLKFEIFHTPGETPDALTVWLPKYKAAFVGDNFYDSFPNIYTLRGTPPRWALEYVASINKVLELQPEIVLPSHGLPIKGHDEIVRRLTRYRDAIQYVHDATVRGMNDGKDVFTLMREIKLPSELELGESYGKVAWSVRGVYEGYVGWFDLNPVTMYAASPNAADKDLVELSGGAAAVAAKSSQITRSGDPVRGLRLADAALAAEATNRDALAAKLLALEALQTQTRNGLEHAWLGYGIRGVQKALGVSAEKSSAK